MVDYVNRYGAEVAKIPDSYKVKCLYSGKRINKR
jgi:hypothetical protein